ncbi:MAG: methyl-accepting chemotaxis protein [bacterium]
MTENKYHKQIRKELLVISCFIFVFIFFTQPSIFPQGKELTTEEKLLELMNQKPAVEPGVTKVEVKKETNSSEIKPVETEQVVAQEAPVVVEEKEQTNNSTITPPQPVETKVELQSNESGFPISFTTLILLAAFIAISLIIFKIRNKIMHQRITRFKDWGIATKIISVAIVSTLLISFVVLFYFLPSFAEQMRTNKVEVTKNLVEVAHSLLKEYDQRVTNGEFSLEESQKRAMKRISTLRYAGDNYFWINDLHPKMVMHPIKPALDGTDLTENKDPNGKQLFVEFVKVCQAAGEGLVDYMWPKPGIDQPVPKISYVKLYKPWGWIIGSGTYVDDVDELIAGMRTKVFLGLGLAFIISVFVALYMGKYIGKPVKKLTEAADKLATGNIDVSLDIDSQDEVGRLSGSFTKMIENIKEQANAVECISRGDLKVVVNVKSDKDVLSQSLLKLIEIIRNLITESVKLSTAAIEGKLSERGNIDKFSGGYKEIVAGINSTLEAIIMPFSESKNVLEKIADGDLTARMNGDYKGDFNLIKNSINELADSFNNTLVEFTDAIEATASASHQISSSAEEMAAGSQEQSAQTSEVASAIEEMTRTIIENTKNTTFAAERAKSSGEKAIEGGKVVEETIDGMSRIADVVNSSAATVETLGNSSNQIGEIIQVIDDIADQTNLLALNAAIEAARAGEQGRGFAVVADEVRKLAERTTKATKEIASMIKKIQLDTAEAVESIQTGKEEVERGKLLVHKAGASLNEIIASADKAVDIITQVAAASEEQSATAEQISKSIDGINAVTHESATGIQQIAQSTEDLSKLTMNLQEKISQFKLTSSKQFNHVRNNDQRKHQAA